MSKPDRKGMLDRDHAVLSSDGTRPPRAGADLGRLADG